MVEVMTEYLEGTLPAEERERFEEHLGLCSVCLEYLEQIRLTIKVLSSLTGPNLDQTIKEGLLTRFGEWKTSSNP
jgi:hypothetical protein